MDIFLLASGWLFISCAIAHMLGEACDIGQTSAQQLNEPRIVNDPSSLTDDDSCVGLILERLVVAPTTYFQAFFPLPANHGGAATRSTPKLPASSRQATTSWLTPPAIRLTPVD